MYVKSVHLCSPHAPLDSTLDNQPTSPRHHLLPAPLTGTPRQQSP